jgi:hypothetical protein
MPQRHILIIVFVLLAVLARAPFAVGEEPNVEGNVFANQKIGVPIYDPQSKQYFAFNEIGKRGAGANEGGLGCIAGETACL